MYNLLHTRFAHVKNSLGLLKPVDLIFRPGRIGVWTCILDLVVSDG